MEENEAADGPRRSAEHEIEASSRSRLLFTRVTDLRDKSSRGTKMNSFFQALILLLLTMIALIR